MSEHSKKFYVVKDDYNNGFWDINKVRRAVVKGWITESEFTEITGVAYTE